QRSRRRQDRICRAGESGSEAGSLRFGVLATADSYWCDSERPRSCGPFLPRNSRLSHVLAWRPRCEPYGLDGDAGARRDGLVRVHAERRAQSRSADYWRDESHLAWRRGHGQSGGNPGFAWMEGARRRTPTGWYGWKET